MTKQAQSKAKPFLKWAGGKRQLLPQIDRFLPDELKDGSISRYVEPFVGSGAVFFHIAQNYSLDQHYISDSNPELILAYRTIQRCPENVIDVLREIESDYRSLTEEERKMFFYDQREKFNAGVNGYGQSRQLQEEVLRTAQLIFLNRTCYNGLFRVNSKGGFNVPFGSYRNPTICDAVNLRAVSVILQRTEIQIGSYKACKDIVDKRTLVYFDPPYRPISKTANFTAYSSQVFDDAAQMELAQFYRGLHESGARLMLSNSDPKNEDPNDRFFDNAYADFRIERVTASRRINSQADKRGPVHELLILNY